MYSMKCKYCEKRLVKVKTYTNRILVCNIESCLAYGDIIIDGINQNEKILNKALKIGYQYKKYTTTIEILTKKMELLPEKPTIKGVREKL